MRRFHAIAGLPRSGSTLLQNILNQNPLFHATSTSPVPFWIEAVGDAASNSLEFKSELASDRESTEARLAFAIRGMVSGWYPGDEVVFDKSRIWTRLALSLYSLFPKSVLILCVRDPREVFASIEKQHRRSPLLHVDPHDGARTLMGRAVSMMSSSGIIGASIAGISDVIRRQIPNAVFVKYEELVKNPTVVVHGLYDTIGEEIAEHDFSHIINTSIDLDAVYLYKFPHEGCGAVEDSGTKWHEWITQDVGDFIFSQSAMFCETFGYEREGTNGGSRPKVDDRVLDES